MGLGLRGLGFRGLGFRVEGFKALTIFGTLECIRIDLAINRTIKYAGTDSWDLLYTEQTLQVMTK